MQSSVNFIVNPVFSGWSPYDDRLGGTEESVVEWARELNRRDHKVTVYSNVPVLNDDKFEDARGYVKYRPYMQYKPADVCINVKYKEFPTTERTFYLSNETDIADFDLDRFEGVILPSKWALDNLGLYHKNIKILPHGFDEEYIFPESKKIRNQCLYSSSPDRGLSELVDLWPEVVERNPKATLIVTYGGKIDLPNTMCLGDVDYETMCELYRDSDFWLHPCLGGELFCMAAVKAQVAGAIPVVYPTMALKETVRHGIRTDRANFVDDLVSIMEDGHKQRWLRNKMKYEPFANWQDSTDILETIIN